MGVASFGLLIRPSHRVCVVAAPIIRYMMVNKWSYWRILGYCAEKRWELEVLEQQ